MRHATYAPCESIFKPEDRAVCNLTDSSSSAVCIPSITSCYFLSRLSHLSLNHLTSCLSFSCALFLLSTSSAFIFSSACSFFFSASPSSSCFLYCTCADLRAVKRPSTRGIISGLQFLRVVKLHSIFYSFKANDGPFWRSAHSCVTIRVFTERLRSHSAFVCARIRPDWQLLEEVKIEARSHQDTWDWIQLARNG